jgi:protein O-GlcNAc transferase
VCEYLDGHTIGKLYRGRIRELARDRRFEVVLMGPSRVVDNATGAIDALAARIAEFPRSLFDARSAIVAEQCDVLFYPEIGMDELT